MDKLLGFMLIIKLTLLLTDKLFYRPLEAAESLSLGRSKVYEMLASGELPAVRIGRRILVPVDGLRRWAQKQVACVDVDNDNLPESTGLNAISDQKSAA